MSYNGIGLSTARGSGTNGYVQRNMGALRAHQKEASSARVQMDREQAPAPPKRANPQILEHNRRRVVDLRVMEMQDRLEQEGVDEVMMQKRLQDYRKMLLEQLERGQLSMKPQTTSETHVEALKREQKNDRMRKALRVGSDYESGTAFDQELQMQRKQDRPKPPGPSTRFLDRTSGPPRDRHRAPRRRSSPTTPRSRSRSRSRRRSRSPPRSSRNSRPRRRSRSPPRSSRDSRRRRRSRSPSSSSSCSTCSSSSRSSSRSPRHRRKRHDSHPPSLSSSSSSSSRSDSPRPRHQSRSVD